MKLEDINKQLEDYWELDYLVCKKLLIVAQKAKALLTRLDEQDFEDLDWDYSDAYDNLVSVLEDLTKVSEE